MRFLPKWLFFVVLVASGYLLVAGSPAKAQTTELASPTGGPIPNNLHNYTQQVLLDLSSGLVCQLVGIDPSGPDPITGQPKKCLGYDVSGKLGFISPSTSSGSRQVGGAIGMMGNLIGVLYTPPVSSGDYFRYLADNFGLVKPAYAQTGTGFDGLKPLLGVWTVMRNMAYLVLVLVFVAVGILVMLRVKIDPRTVMSIQNQIPRILITLILVTFSYAIAGFLIDFMYLMTYFFINLLSTVPTAPGSIPLSPPDITRNLAGQNVLGFFNTLSFQNEGGIIGIVESVAGSVYTVVGDLFAKTALGHTIGGLIGATIGGLIGGLVGGATCVFTGFGTLVAPLCALLGAGAIGGSGAIFSEQVLGGVAALLLGVIVLIAVLWTLFRLWFQLIMAYVFILLDVAFAPLWILTGAFPGAGLGFGSWFRDIFANLSAFPVTIGMFLLGKLFVENFSRGSPNQFVPPLIGNPGDTGAVGAFIGLGIIFLTPQVVNMVRDAFKAPPFKYAFAIGQALGAGGGVFTGPTRPLIQASTWMASQAAIGRLIPGLRGVMGGTRPPGGG